jgi:hypothetical protein
MPSLAAQPDLEDLHAGLEAYLRADATLATLAPGGVWFDVKPQTAPDGVTVIYRLQAGDKVQTHDRAGYEVVRYSVVATGMGQTGSIAAAVTAAAKRVRALLEGQTFEAVGYSPMCEIDGDFDPILQSEYDGQRWWQMRGRVWKVTAALLAA